LPTDDLGVVVYLGPQTHLDLVRAELGGRFDVRHARDEDAVDRMLGDARVVLDASMAVPFSAERIARASSLELFVTATTGADHVDVAALAARQVPLLTLRGQTEVLGSLTPAAEHSWLLVLACARDLRGATGQVLDGSWDRTRHPGTMLRGRTIGIVGCGRIGQWVGRYAEAFGMRRLGYDPDVSPWPHHIERVDLPSLLRSADVVSVHVPLNETTTGLIGARELALMKPDAILVNTSRGEVVDEAALVDAVRSGRLGAVGVDVLTGEPEVAEHPLVRLAADHTRVVITPHIGGFSPDAVQQVLAFSCRRIADALGARV
jgi:D-3-phosphoglycerate dehydrogenase